MVSGYNKDLPVQIYLQLENHTARPIYVGSHFMLSGIDDMYDAGMHVGATPTPNGQWDVSVPPGWGQAPSVRVHARPSIMILSITSTAAVDLSNGYDIRAPREPQTQVVSRGPVVG